MNSKIQIELFEEHNKVNLYTIRFRGEETETDKFFDQFPEGSEYDDDIDIIIKWLDQIGERSALERYFRTEGRFHDRIWAIPIEDSKLRLYVIRLSENILILGNGGIKDTATYNEDPHLTRCVELLQQIDCYIKTRMQKGKINIYQKQLFGDLMFHLNPPRSNEEK